MPDLATLGLLLIALILAHGANARFARWITEDDNTAWIRAHLNGKYGTRDWRAKLFKCPWCLGFWTAWPVAALAWFPIMGLGYWWLFGLAGWSVAHAAGRLNHNHEPSKG